MTDTISEVPPRCEREHRFAAWPRARRCEGEAVDTVTLDGGEELRVCALCKLDADQGERLDVVHDNEGETSG